MFVLFFKMILSLSWAGGNFVGNGGDGYLTNKNTIYLRDLVEVGTHQTPWIGDSDNPEIHRRVLNLVSSVDFPKDKLSRKLTDLNQASPYFGDMVLRAIQMYNWIFVEAKLGIISDDGDVIQPIGEFVQIANRLGTIIRIHHDSWNKMSEENQVALILHEAIYSMLKPKQISNVLFAQSPRKVREIIGLLFSTNFKLRGQHIFTNTISRELEIPDANYLRQTPTQELIWRMKIWQLGSDTLHAEKPIAEMSIKQNLSHSELTKYATEYCQLVINLKKQNTDSSFSLFSRIDMLPFRGQFNPYESTFGEQYAVKFEAQAQAFEVLLQPTLKTTTQQCLNEISYQIDEMTSQN